MYLKNGCYWGLFESGVLTYCSCCWGPFWKQCTYTLKLLLRPFKSRVLTHCSCCWGPFWQKSTCTMQLVLGATFKAVHLHTAIAVGAWQPFW